MSEFPEGFKWGAATASYQIEGAFDKDGRGPSIWDTFSKTPGKVKNADNGDVACDHYHRFEEDIQIMKDLGIQTYRFSLAWPRLFPEGDSRREQRGFDFYNRLIDALIAAGIEPIITAYHWDLPQPLQDKGGWANRDTAYAFADYMAAAVEAFGDRVQSWLTLNEPWCTSWLGYGNGVHAPGVQNLNHAIAAAHHTALAHGLAVRAALAVNPTIKVGIAVNMTNYIVTNPENRDLLELQELMDGQLNRWWLDALTTGHYPAATAASFGEKLDRVFMPGDSEILKVRTDFVGINYYSDGFLNEPGPEVEPIEKGMVFPFPQRTDGSGPPPYTDIGWPITPEGLGNLVVRVARDWPELEIIISENGACFPEGPDANGEVHDTRRVDYLDGHLQSLARGIAEGAPVTAYYVWSLLDNFEWAEGYEKRFGIVHVDFDTLKRTPKASADFYAKVIATNGESLKSAVI